MPLALAIHPSSDSLDLYGDADSSSTISLSGHVSLSLSSPSSWFSQRKLTARFLLQSLTITFEGQSETLSPQTGYAPIRLCSITRELVPGEPVEISNDGHEESDQPCVWNVVFDITVPGWLPTTSVYGDTAMQATGTSYALYATATFVDINHGRFPFSFANICGPVLSRTCTVDAHRYPITLQRLAELLSDSSGSAFPMSVYIVDARREPDSEGSSQRSIPDYILEKIQVVASVPSATTMDETSLPFILRVRGKDLSDSERKQLRITEFSVDVEQVEVYRRNMSRDDVNQHPVPSQSYQPPRVPLRNPHPIHTLYGAGFLGTFKSSVKRSFSLLAPTESGTYVISGNGHIFDLDYGPSAEDNWYILEIKVPIFTEPHMRDWAGVQRRRITETSPLFSVEHRLHVAVCCEYDLVDGTIVERLHFSLPMQHVNVPKVSIPLGDAVKNQCEDVQRYATCTPTLPAYSQLFHSNGERKLDYLIPLPLYEPPSASSSSEFTSDQHRTL